MSEHKNKLFGLLGRKLGHSFSPEIHSEIGRAAGQPYEYRLFEKEPDQLESFLRNGDWQGLNVTVPYKEEVMQYLDEVSEEALAMGAVNTVVRRDGRLKGYNTDYYGFRQTLENAHVPVADCRCLVFGDGGASKAVQQVLRDMQAKKMTVVSRRGRVTYQDLDSCLDADVLINTTPVGMYPGNGQSVITPERFSSAGFALDLIYNPLRTHFLCRASKAGMKAVSGLEMLVAQAIYAAELFLGRKFPERDAICASIVSMLRTKKQNITLIGMPGVGKTTVGMLLAQKLGRTLYDTDEMIVKLDGRSIPQIFAEDGEKYFRSLESGVASDLCSISSAVISCGGGIIKYDENYFSLAENSFIVFLNRDLAKLPVEGRPLSLAKPAEELYKERLPLYRSWCDLELNIENLTPEETADLIIEKFSQA